MEIDDDLLADFYLVIRRNRKYLPTYKNLNKKHKTLLKKRYSEYQDLLLRVSEFRNWTAGEIYRIK